MKRREHLAIAELAKGNGFGTAVRVSFHESSLLVPTLDINSVTNQGSLLTSVWGWYEGVNWGAGPLISFPKKYYCGIYSILLNLASYPEIRHLRLE